MHAPLRPCDSTTVVVHIDRRPYAPEGPFSALLELFSPQMYHAEVQHIRHDGHPLAVVEAWGVRPEDLQVPIQRAYRSVMGVGTLLYTNGTDVPSERFGINTA